MAQPIPSGYHSVTPSLTLKDCQKAIDFYKKAFNAKVLDLAPNPVGTGIMHAVIQIGNSLLMMGDEAPGMSAKSAETLGATPISLYLYVPNVDEAFQQALNAGAVATMPVADMFWGDRAGNLKDPFGYTWMLATHLQDLSKDQIKKGAEAFFAGFQKK